MNSSGGGIDRSTTPTEFHSLIDSLQVLTGRGTSFGVEKTGTEWEFLTMTDTLLREKNQVTLSSEVVEAAGLVPSKDRIVWRFEGGEIRGRKIVRRMSKTEVVRAIDSSPLKFSRSWEQMRKETRES
jgi:hypothetical protein